MCYNGTNTSPLYKKRDMNGIKPIKGEQKMGLFGKKKEVKEQKPIEEVMAQNVFGKTLMPGEKIDYCVQGKGQAEKLIFSTAVLATTEKRCLYFEQDGSQTKTETLMYDKIVAISQNTGFEKKMGNYIGITITTADGKERIVRCVANNANQAKINELISVIESRR